MKPKLSHSAEKPGRTERIAALMEKTGGTITYVGQLALALPSIEDPVVIIDDRGKVLEGDASYLEWLPAGLFEEL